MKIAIHQPNFIPWIGYFHKMSMVDTFVFFDDVQFPRGKSYGNRVKIKTNSGELWLTVPVSSKGDLSQFSEVRIQNETSWQLKMLKTIELAYKKAPHFDKYYDGLRNILQERHEKLLDLNVPLITYIAESIGIKSIFRYSSEIPVIDGDNPDDRIINILKYLKADLYVSGRGAGSARYIDEERFLAEQISLEWQVFNPPVYSQLWGEFLPGLSAIDLLFNCGDESQKFLF